MNLKELTKEEIEALSFDDIAYMILKEKKKKQTTLDLFKKVCELQGLNESVVEDKIADFFSLLLTDQRFIQLDKGFWDLKENHKVKINMEELENDSEEDDDIIEITDNDILEDEESDEEYIDDSKDVDDDPEEDDLKDLVIVDEDIDEDNIM